MVTVQEALNLIKEHCSTLPEEKLPIEHCVLRTNSQHITAKIHMPPFDQSAMDGYAINSGDSDISEYQIIDEIKAGDNGSSVVLEEGQAVRIFTGAMVPASATSVIKQESTKVEGDSLRITEEIKNGNNIRLKGEQYNPGDIIVPSGNLLTPGTVGLIATNGVSHIDIYTSPKIHLITTGNELVKSGETLKPGKIYESNTAMLVAAFEQYGFDITTSYVGDDREATEKLIEQAIGNNQLVILSGGISVGDYDFVQDSLEKCAVQEIFYKVKQKPGKPLYFGKTNSCSVFALPGNPASALNCFYIYVLKALEIMTGRQTPFLERRQVTLSHDHFKKGTFTNYLKAHVENNEVSVLKAQSSAMLAAYNSANAILEIPAEINECKEGEKYWVSCIL
jgi:molybdopterin molybdotransferase